jgi:pyruvate dehydrogenase E2 component (dihydrolipoamide acetyltransferase)
MAFEFKLPDIGEGIVEGEIVRWLVKEGDRVEADQPLVEILTDKATVEIPSPIKGRLAKTVGKDGDIIEVGKTLLVIDEMEGTISPRLQEPSDGAEPSTGSSARTPEAPDKTREVLTTPAVRKQAREMGIDIQTVQGTGPKGRITAEDLERYIEEDATDETGSSGPQPAVESMPYRGLRKRIGDRLSLSERTAVHFTYIEEADATDLVQMRRDFSRSDEGKNLKLTYLPFFLKAAVSGLAKYPMLNASLDERRSEILLKKYYNIGIAAHTPDGLMVPVVRDVDKKSLIEVAGEIHRLSQAASSGTIALEDLRDSTFTITSLGNLGGIAATPIIHYPEVAILAVHKIAPRPVVRNGEIVIREMVNLTLSLDHRVVDGTVAAQFLHHVISLIEHPGDVSEFSKES